jgi:hypothetical protein
MASGLGARRASLRSTLLEEMVLRPATALSYHPLSLPARAIRPWAPVVRGIYRAASARR